jgi:hypothetical protein
MAVSQVGLRSMARLAKKLSARKVETLKILGRYSDGAGLYLRVTPVSRKWCFQFTWNRRKVEIGLGAARDVPLASAREKAARFREMVVAGVDPREERKEKKANTFGEVALQFIERQEGSWRNEKHRDQWRYSLSLRKHLDETKPNFGEWIDEGSCVSIRDKPIANLSTSAASSFLVHFLYMHRRHSDTDL